MTAPSDPSGAPGRPAPTARERTLAALQAMAKPQPKPSENPASSPEQIPDSASGFVGMLAKGQFSSAEGQAPSATLPPEPGTAPRTSYPLRMAREIPPASHAPGAPPVASREAAKAPQSAIVPGAAASQAPVAPQPVVRTSRFTSYFLTGLALLLLLIGAWAIGALAYIYAVQPNPIASENVHYPLIRWSLDMGNTGEYTRGSLFMAWSMLVCIPVSAAFVVMARMFLKPTRHR